MARTTTRRLRACASLLAAVGLPVSAWAQDAAPASAPAAPVSAPTAPATPGVPAPEGKPAAPVAVPAAAPPGTISFNFKDAPLDQVLDVFARQGGVPIIFEAPAPQGTLTFISAANYTFDDALSILNLNLQRFNVHLRKQDQYLYLSTIQDAMKRPAAVAADPKTLEKLSPDEIVTVSIPLDNARAEQVTEQIKQLVGPFGGVIAVPAQNMVVVVESAAQVRRIRDVIGAIDKVRPADAAFKLFPLKHAQCDTVLNALKGLMSERSKTVIVDKDGQQRVVQDQQVQGLSIVADPRTNSIVAIGPAARLQTVEEVIHLLDVPEGDDGDTQMETFALSGANAEQLAQRVTALFAKGDPKKLPTVLPLPEVAKLTVIGRAEQLRQAAALVAEVDPEAKPVGEAPGTPERRAVTLRLSHVEPAGVQRILDGILSQRQKIAVRFAPTPDNKGLVVMGPETDVAGVEQIVRSLDVETDASREVRVTHIGGADGADTLKRAQDLYTQSGKNAANPVQATFYPESSSAAIVGSKEGLTAFEQILSGVADSVGPKREVRLIEIKQAKAADVAAFLADLARSSGSLLNDNGPSPVFQAIGSTNQLLVGATPAQMPVIESLARNMDSKSGAERPPLRILSLKSTDAANLASVLQRNFDARPQEERVKKPANVEADVATNTLIVSAHPDMLAEIEGIVEKLNENKLNDGTGREIRIFPLKVARAEELAQTIDQMFPDPPVPLDPRTRQPRYDLKPPKEVTVRADRATNALIVDAPAKRLAGFEQLVENLDRQKLADNVALRSYHVERADLNNVANTIRQLASTNALGAKSSAPVTVAVDAGTRTLLASGPTEIFPAVEDVLKKLDAGPDQLPTEMKLYTLQAAKADRIQPLVERVLSARAREQLVAAGKTPAPEARLVEVASDAASNTLVVNAPRETIAVCDGIIKALDQGSVAGATEVRVYRLQKGEAASVATALGAALKAQDKPGDTAATITPEPASNTIVIVGNQAQLDRAATLVEQLDASVEKDGMGVKTITLKHARSEALAPVLEQLLARESSLDKMPEWARVQAIARGATEPPRVHVAADPRLNALIISGPRAVLDMAEQIAATLDVDAASATGGQTLRVVTLKNADAAQLATNLEAVLKDDKSTEPPPVIRVDSASNSLIVRGSASQLATLDELTTKLDAAAGVSSRQMRVISVDRARADADMLARTLQRLMEQQGGVKVEIISAEELLKRTKGATPEDPKDTKKSSDARGSLRQGIELTPARAGGTWWSQAAFAGIFAGVFAGVVDPDSADVTIAVDSSTNSIIIVGSPRTADRLAALADELQRQMPTEPTSVHIVAMPPATDLDTVTQMLRQTIQQIGRASPQNPGGFSGPTTIFPDPAGNALVVLCNKTDFDSIGTLIANFSQSAGGAKMTIKVYPLTSVASARAIGAVRDLFSQQPQGFQARRVRSMDISIAGEQGAVSARLDPATIGLASDPGGTSIIVAAPDEAIPVIDRMIETIDQSPTKERLAIKRYELKNARASELSRTFQSLFDAQRQGPSSGELPQARFVPDDRTNSILVTASSPQHADVARLLQDADAKLDQGDQQMAIITLQQAAPSTVQRIVDEVLVGRDPAMKDRIRISAQDGSSLIVVRAAKEDMERVKGIIAQVDQAETGGLPVRTIKLERADAGAVAAALQTFFQNRANVSARPGVRTTNRVAIVGDTRSGTLVIAASDDDLAQVKELVKTFDTPAPAQDLQFKVIPLKNARVTDVASTISSVVDELRWETRFGNQSPNQLQTQVHVEPNERTNSIVVVGKGDEIATVEHVIATLDVPDADRSTMTITSVKVKAADMRALQSVLSKAFVTPGWRSWRGPDPEGVTVEIDKAQRSLILVGKAERVKQAAAYIAQLDALPGGEANHIESLTLEHARADRAAQSLRQFFSDRAQAQGVERSSVSVIGSADGNVLIVSGDEDSLKIVRDLVAQIDQPDGGKDRRIDVIVLKNAQASDVSSALRSMFARDTKGDERVVITPQPSTNSVIVSAPQATYPEVLALLKQLDAAPKADEANIETVALSQARAQDVAAALKSALPPNVKVTVTPVVRSNSLMLTGSKEAIAIAMDQIRKIDTGPVRSGQIFRRFKLVAADAGEVSYTIDELLRARPQGPNEARASIDYSRADNTLTVYAPADQIDEIEKIVKEIDQAPAEERTTEFVKLAHANAMQTANALKVFYGRGAAEAATPAARQVTILPDSLSNSLVIRADKTQWEGIRALLAKLDTKDYDTNRQLDVIALEHADAASVAKALNEGLRAPLEEQLRQAQIRDARQRQGGNSRPNDRPQEPTVLIDAQGVPTVSAEPQTNSLVVFAGTKEMEQIRGIVKQLDVSGFADMPKARIIPLRNGKPSVVAGTIRELFLNKNERISGPRAVLVIGDDSTGALIVRADDEKFAQVKALAETLEQQGQIGRVQPHVVRLKNIAAGRLRQTLLSTFSDTAKTQGETLAIEIDRGSNSLVIACSERLLGEIQKVITELDAAELQGVDAKPGDTGTSLAQNVTIIDVTNTSPAEMRKLLEDMGLTKPQAADRPGVVSEQVAIVPMVSRRAIAVVGSPADGRVVESLVKLLDASPVDAQQQLAVVPLKTASAKPVADMLLIMLHPGDAGTEAVKTGPAQALAEQVRRLQLLRAGIDQPKDAVDLTKPIRVIPDVEANAIVIASTQGNIDALREVIKSLDVLPVGEAVVMRIFPLENASATRARQVIEQLFSQGENLRRLPGTKRQGLPPTATGQALAGDIAAAVDERTNTLIVAGREEAVALIELLVKDMDSDRASKWIEPMVLPLKHADAASLARKLNDVLVKGLTTTPEAAGLQRQFGRLRMIKNDAAATPPAQAELGDGAKAPAPPAGQPGGPAKPTIIESDMFAPLTGLAITADDQLNALIVVASPANNAVVRALVDQLDVEAASAANSARIFPLRYAAAERVTSILKDIFKQRQGTTQDRPEDQLIISSDVRTNSLIISTSQKSFAIVDGLLKTLDGEKSNFSVGLHVITVIGADVKQLAPRIDRLMRERIQAAAQVGSVRSSLDAFSIEPEPASNLLIVACSDENLQVVNELVKALTEDAQKLAGGERVDVVQLAKARAAEMATQVQSLYVDKENARRGTGAVSVVPNERLNALIVSGNEQDLIEVRALAKKLDGAEVAQKQQIKWIELKSANAGEVVRLVENVLAGRPVGGGRGIGARQATRLQFLRDSVRSDLANQKAEPPTEADVDGAIKDQVTLTPDIRTNSVWITAPEAMVTLISEMIDDIESSSAGQRRIERFRLVNADAVKMRDLLRDIFNLQQQGNALVLVPARSIEDRRRPDADQPPGGADSATIQGANLTPVPDERQQLAIAVDQRTNSLIVSGTEDYLELVRKVVNELDSISANERERRVYHLRNAKAKEIETTLKAYFQGESDKARLTLGNDRTGSLEKRLEEEVTVVGDDASNKLVISTSPRYMESVLKIVDELDQSPPQVMIQVLLAEVTIDASDQWGLDATVGPLGGEMYKGGITAQGVGVATALGVPNLSVSSADFSVLIRALQMQGKLEVLSNPQVLANNNKEATIKVVDNLGVAGRTQAGISVGTIISEVDRIDAGIILKVTPSISTDGYVRMEISPEISQLSARTTQINENQTSPIITKRTVDTVVTVKDGQSVVIGGLIQSSDEERDSKVPILGDIPILGWPFRTKSNAATKTELLVILTPRVIPGQAANSDDLVRDVTEQSLDKLEDPGKVSDYLERIRQDIQRSKQLHGGYDPQPANPGAASPPPAENPRPPADKPATPAATPATPATPAATGEASHRSTSPPLR